MRILSTGVNFSKPIQKIKHNNFKGHHYSFGYFTDEEIVDTYKYMKYSDDEWRAIAKYDFTNECSFFKYCFGGGAEKIELHLKEMARLRKGLQEQAKQDELRKEEARKKVENLILNPAKVKFQDDFISLLDLEKEGNSIEIPNGILLENENADLNSKFINWLKLSNEFLFKEINHPKCDWPKPKRPILHIFLADVLRYYLHNGVIPSEASLRDEYNKRMRKFEVDLAVYNEKSNKYIQACFLKNLDKSLKQAKEDYSTNGKRTLLYIPSFELIGTEQSSNKQIIATLKALMTSCAEKYKCSLLLNIPKEKLKTIDPILLVDSRIQLKLKI